LLHEIRGFPSGGLSKGVSVRWWFTLLLEVHIRRGYCLWVVYDLFLSRVRTMTRDIDIAILSVRPSVRLSITFRYSMETA